MRLGWSHARVTTGVLVVNLLLAGIALVSLARPSLLLSMVGLGTLFLTGLYLWLERRLPMASAPYVNPGFEAAVPGHQARSSDAGSRPFRHRYSDPHAPRVDPRGLPRAESDSATPAFHQASASATRK